MFACLAFAGAGSSFAATYTWDGGLAAGTANWGNVAMWDGDPTPVFDNTADIVFYKTGTTLNLTNAINGDRTIRSLSYTADADTTVNVRTRQAVGNVQLGRVLTFDADSGNATITVDAGSAATAHAINGGAVSAGGAGGSILLTDSLNVIHNSTTATLTMGQVNDGTNAGSETPITGPGGINKSGVGVLALAGPNNFAGGVNISAGRVHVQSNTALGTGGVTLSGTGAELRLSSNGVVTPAANTLTVSDTGDAKVLQGLVASGTTTFSGAITINETTAGNFELAAGTTHTFTVSGNISGTTAAGIKKSSSGTLVLSGVNDYTGDTLVSNGTLKIGSATAIPSSVDSTKGVVNVSGGASQGGVLDLNGNDTTVCGLYGGSTSATFKGEVLNSVAGTKTLTLNEARIQGAVPPAVPQASISFNGLIKDNAGTGGVVALKKTNTGTSILNGANSFTGGLTIENGRVELGHNTAAGTGTITLADTGAQVQTGGGVTIGNPLTVSDTGDLKTLRHYNATPATYSGTITVNESTEGNFWVQAGTGAQLTITGDITGSGAGGVTKVGVGGTIVFQGAKTYTGTTTVSGGTLTLDTAYLADASSVKIGTGAILNLTHANTDTVDKLFLNGVQQQAGVYTAVGNAGPGETAIAEITGTGKLQVTTSPPVTGYTSWLTGYTFAPGADTTRTGDPDGDGFTNLQEFLFGTNPTTGTQVLSSVEKSGTDLVIRWKERTTGCTYQLKQSATLANDWINAVGGTIGNDGAVVGDYQPRIATIPIGIAKLFFRVEGIEN